ncbi:EKC KEOPS complex subunit [Lecanosticta acicola]|uniref:EKC/KEOPS complex subunit CGI121 n=1 Tax=Lecanosticta acicola TaxID=111012 RepID=A0AAI9EFA5_9PEZI|nr:EKC KEOPS complex subunit [Lecanosticta acicola]
METVELPHMEQHPLHLCLFRDLHNAPFLRQQLLQGNTDFQYAFLDASVLLSRNHVFSACFRAINDMINHRMKSRNVHSEIVFAMSPNNNIAESFRRFGIQDDSKNIVAVKVGSDRETVEKHLFANVQGNASQLDDETLASLHDAGRLRKIYRLDAPKKGEALVLGNEAEAFTIGTMSLKGS